MGKHLNKLRKLDKIVARFQDTIEELLEISREGIKHPDKELSMFVFAYAYLNYQFAIYLIQKFPEAINADKIDKEFNNIMKDFEKKNGKKKKKDWWKDFWKGKDK